VLDSREGQRQIQISATSTERERLHGSGCTCINKYLVFALLTDMDWTRIIRLIVESIHFDRINTNEHLPNCRYHSRITRAHMHECSLVGVELVCHPLWAHHAGRGGEGLGAGSAPRRLVAVEPLVHVSLTDDCTIIGDSVVHQAACSHHCPFLLSQGLQRSSTLFTAQSARVLEAHPRTQQAIHHTPHTAPHAQHTRTLSASGTHN
jgi:hypothetical protein